MLNNTNDRPLTDNDYGSSTSAVVPRMESPTLRVSSSNRPQKKYHFHNYYYDNEGDEHSPIEERVPQEHLRPCQYNRDYPHYQFHRYYNQY